MQFDVQPSRGVSRELLAQHRLARLGLTDLNDASTGGRLSEVVVEGEDAMHFGAREIERLGDERNGCGRDIAQRSLHCVQDQQQRAGLGYVVAQRRLDRVPRGRIEEARPCLSGLHAESLLAHGEKSIRRPAHRHPTPARDWPQGRLK